MTKGAKPRRQSDATSSNAVELTDIIGLHSDHQPKSDTESDKDVFVEVESTVKIKLFVFLSPKLLGLIKKIKSRGLIT